MSVDPELARRVRAAVLAEPNPFGRAELIYVLVLVLYATAGGPLVNGSDATPAERVGLSGLGTVALEHVNAVHAVHGPADERGAASLDLELEAGVRAAVLAEPDAESRANLIYALIDGIYEAVKERYAGDGRADTAERASPGRLRDAALEHLEAMGPAHAGR